MSRTKLPVISASATSGDRRDKLLTSKPVQKIGIWVMADYYSLISRAVAALQENTFEDRRGIYNRVRSIQSYRLGKRTFNKKDFDRERSMLEDAISQVETEATGKRIAPDAFPSTPVQPSDIGPSPMMPLPSARSWLKRMLLWWN